MNKRFETIDLKPYMNRRLVYDPKKKEKVVGLCGDGFSELDFFRFGETFGSKAGIPFLFERTDERNDVVECGGQSVPVREGVYAKIYLAGFMYWGPKYDYLRLTYADGTAEKVKFCFSDWSHEIDEGVNDMRLHAEFGQVSTLRRLVACCDDYKGYKGTLHVSTYPCDIKQPKPLVRIDLPDNQFAHVFAMTLEEA